MRVYVNLDPLTQEEDVEAIRSDLVLNMRNEYPHVSIDVGIGSAFSVSFIGVPENLKAEIYLLINSYFHGEEDDL